MAAGTRIIPVMPPAPCPIRPARVGTSGWSYAHWARGRFYPKGLPPGRWLPFLAQHFNTVELNASFYRPPRQAYIQRWCQLTPSRFRFAVKLWRRITHEKRLADCANELRSFLDLFKPLARKRAPLLVQLPPSLRPDLDRLEPFLTELKRALGRSRWRVAVEFRNDAWRCDRVYRLLDDFGVALCLADMPRCPFTEPNDAAFVYIRRHGPAGGYRASYSDNQLAADADRIRNWLRAGRDVYIYFNNDIDGYAVDNATRLRELLV